MSYTCQICGKKSTKGFSQQHRRGVAGKRWKKGVKKTPRLFRPNLQTISLKIEEKVKKMRICTSCLKRIRKFGSIDKYKSIYLL